MSRVEQLEQQIAALDQDELRMLRSWFARFDADDWDRQIASDAKSGTIPPERSGSLTVYSNC